MGFAPSSLSSHCGVMAPSAALRFHFPVVQGPRYCEFVIKIGKVFGHVDRHFVKKVFPSKPRLSQFREVATSFLALPSSQERMWQHLLGHMASLESFFFLEVTCSCARCSGASRITGPPWWTILPSWCLCCRSVWMLFAGGSRRTVDFLVFLFRYPLHPCFYIQMCVC